MAAFGFDFDDLKKKAKEGIESVQQGAQNFDAQAALKKAADDISKGADDATKALGEGVRNFDAGEAMQKIGDAASAGVDEIGKAIGGLTNQIPEEDQEDSSRSFIALLCYLAAADGSVSQAEKEKISAISTDLDGDANANHLETIDEFVMQVHNESDEFGYLAAAKMNARRMLEGATLTDQEKKVICWNLFAVASADGLSTSESDFIRYVCEQTNLDKAIVEELSNYNDAITELGAVKDRMRTSNKSFSEIEPLVDEIIVRERTIIKAAEALVTDN